MKIVIVDDDCLVTEALKTILEVNEDVQVLATGSDGRDAVCLYAEYKPDEIYMTKKDDIIQAIGHISHNQRNGFSIAKFKALGTLVWDSTNGHYRFDI